jgi:Domain of unknown function (DUF4919)
MIRKLTWAFSILVLFSATATSSTQDRPKDSSQDAAKRFAALVDRAKKSDATLDFKELRLAYTETSDYSPYGSDRESRQKMFAALNAKEFDKAIEFAEKILAKNFVEINGNFGAYVAHRELGHADKAAFRKFMVDGLLKSIMSSGDGKSEATAFVVISTDEEYVLFNFMGLRATGQALITKDGHSFDRMTTTDPKTNETAVYFFNIDKPFNWLGNSLKK